MNEYILTLGIDTSNYKTSLAVTDEDGHIIADSRRFLEVKKGGTRAEAIGRSFSACSGSSSSVGRCDER